MQKTNLSIVIIAKNEEKLIEDCLRSITLFRGLKIKYEIVVIDDFSEDETSKISSKYDAKVFRYHGENFSKKRNEGLKRAQGEWILYLDADERLSQELCREIVNIINLSESEFSCCAIPRKNIIFGKLMRYGGWWPDYVKRLFLKKNLECWSGHLHEEPIFKGKLGHIKNAMTHFKHDTLTEMIDKTNEWSEIEAKLLFQANHPKMTWWRFFRVMLTEAFYRLIVLKGILDGPKGIIYGIYQSWSKFVTYAKLWEMQINS